MEKGEAKQLEPKPEPKDVEIRIFGDIILGSQNFIRIKKDRLTIDGISIAADLLEAITGIIHNEPQASFILRERISDFRDYLIKILEKKFGLKIKICGNCKSYWGKIEDDSQGCMKFKERGTSQSIVSVNYSCEHWNPKEIPEEKKEEKKTCGYAMGGH